MTITVSYGGKELGTTTLVLKKEFKGATATAATVEVAGKIGTPLTADQKITVTLAKPADADANAENPKFKAVTAEEAKKWITGLPEGITATATAIEANATSVEFTLSGTPTSKTGAVAITIPAKYIVGQEDTSSETITAITTNVTFNIADGDIAAAEITALPAAADMVAGTSFTTLEGKITAKTGDDVHYTKGNIKWFSKDTNGSGNYTEATGKTALEGGKSYQVEITLNAATDWAFTDAAKTAITLPDSKTATDSALDTNKKALTFKVELGAVEAGNTGENDTVTGTVTGEVAGTAKVDQTAGTLTDGKKTITVTLDEAYKFVAFDTNNQNALSWFTTPSLTDSGLSVTAAKGTTDNIAILTVGGEATKAVISETVALAIPKELIQKVDGTAITVTGNTVALASTGTAAKFAITASGGTIALKDIGTITIPAPKGGEEVPSGAQTLNVDSSANYSVTYQYDTTGSNADKFVTESDKTYFKAGVTGVPVTVTITPKTNYSFADDVTSLKVKFGNDGEETTISSLTNGDDNKSKVGTVNVTIADGTATVAAADGGVSGTAGGAVTGTVTITLDGDAFNAIEENADLSSLFEFTGLPNDLTPKANAAVTKGAKTAEIKFTGNLASGATTTNDISVKIKADALVSGKTDGISATGNFVITVQSDGTGDDVGGENSIAPTSISDETQEPAEQETVE